MSRQVVIRAFSRQILPQLEALGFKGRQGHFVRSTGGVTEVVELQHSIYGGRITANLGLDLDFLKPVVRWIARPRLGPHAHDSTRWIRVGLVRPERADCWWSFDTGAEDACDVAARGCGRAILDHGVAWLATERSPVAFLRFAEARLERSRSDLHPDGSYQELRLLAAVLAWNGEVTRAREVADRARQAWGEERSRLAAARATYRKKHADHTRRMPAVPDIQLELDLLIDGSGGPPSLDAGPHRRRAGRTRAATHRRPTP